MNLLIPNLGSTSLKYQILRMPSETVLGKGRLERVADYRDANALRTAFAGVEGVFVMIPPNFAPEPDFPETHAIVVVALSEPHINGPGWARPWRRRSWRP